jgi:SNF2 family DNA or RNA helicase
MEVDNPASAEEDADYASFPIVLTTYEMIIKDRVHLSHYDWGYIVVDEGHRLKNLDCKLMKEIKKYKSVGRMILTGTLFIIASQSYGRYSTSFYLTFLTTSTLSKTHAFPHCH